MAKQKKVPDGKAVNPLYGTAKMSDVARALMRPVKGKPAPPRKRGADGG
ncbi:hypothetical protein [Candidatus Palauibacter sp.]